MSISSYNCPSTIVGFFLSSHQSYTLHQQFDFIGIDKFWVYKDVIFLSRFLYKFLNFLILEMYDRKFFLNLWIILNFDMHCVMFDCREKCPFNEKKKFQFVNYFRFWLCCVWDFGWVFLSSLIFYLNLKIRETRDFSCVIFDRWEMSKMRIFF